MLAEEFANFADYIETNTLNGIDAECVRRVTASRNYYHIFHLVNDWYNARFPNEMAAYKAGTHERIRLCCGLLAKSTKDKKFMKLGLKLKVLHDIRVRADYELDLKFNDAEGVTMKSEKATLIPLLNTLMQDHPTPV